MIAVKTKRFRADGHVYVVLENEFGVEQYNTITLKPGVSVDDDIAALQAAFQSATDAIEAANLAAGCQVTLCACGLKFFQHGSPLAPDSCERCCGK